MNTLSTPTLVHPLLWTLSLASALGQTASNEPGSALHRPDASPLAYPETVVGSDSTTLHGVTVADPYRWLENESAAPVRAWASRQNELAESFAGREASAAIAARIEAYSDFVYETAVEEFPKRTFFLRGRPGSPYTGLYRTEKGGAEVHLRGPEIGPGVGSTLSEFVRRYWPSPNGERLVVQLARPGDSFGSLQLIDAVSGVTLRELAAETHNGSASVAWLPDGLRLAMTIADRADAQRPVRHRTVLVELASGRTTTLVAPLEDVPGRHLRPDGPRHAGPRPAVRRARFRLERFDDRADARPRHRVRCRHEDVDAQGESWLFVGARGDDAWFYSSTGAPNGRIFRLSEISGTPRVSTAIAEGSGSIAAGSQVGGNAYGLFGEFLVVLVHEETGPRLRAYDLESHLRWEQSVPPSGSVWGGLTGDPRRPVFFYQFLGVADPSTVQRVDLARGVQTVHAAPALPFSRDSIVAERSVVIGEAGAHPRSPRSPERAGARSAAQADPLRLRRVRMEQLPLVPALAGGVVSPSRRNLRGRRRPRRRRARRDRGTKRDDGETASTPSTTTSPSPRR